MNMLAQFGNSEQSMTSLEIADLVESRHDKVKQSVERLVSRKVIALPPLGIVVKTVNNREYETEVYVFTGEQGKRDSIIVVAQLCPEFTARLVDRWVELENQSPVNLPDYPTALRLYADQLEITARIEQERDHAIATKAEIGSRREATAMGRLSAKVKEVEKLKTQLDSSTGFATIKKVQSLTGGTYDTYELRRYSKAQGLEIQKAEDANYGSVNSYHKDAWLAVYSINLSSIRGA